MYILHICSESAFSFAKISRISVGPLVTLLSRESVSHLSIVISINLQLLQQLHSENMLGYRFPIGLEEQMKKWDPETIRAFHHRWYFPANATLFIVGDIGSVGRTLQMIEVS